MAATTSATRWVVAVMLVAMAPGMADGVVKIFGDKDLSNTGTYPTEPTAGATLEGLAEGAVSLASNSYAHGFPFSPGPTDFPNTDQIFVGHSQTATYDGYAGFAGRIAGPQVFSLAYDDLVPAGQVVTSVTLGILADDFQTPVWGQPYVAAINGTDVSAISNALNGLNQTGPRSQFLSYGVPASLLTSNHVLTLVIDEGGNGGDGWSVDFLTIGIQTAAPQPGDANLNGRIDRDDFALTDRGFAKHLTGWSNGDFSGDNVVNAADYAILNSAYAQSLTEVAGVVPEPGLAPLMAAVALLVPSRAAKHVRLPKSDTRR